MSSRTLPEVKGMDSATREGSAQPPGAAGHNAPARTGSQPGDSDTITVLSKGKPVRIRLHGIDCPEKRQAFGKRAKQFTSRLVYGKTVTVRDLGQDRYGRTIAEVLLPDGRNLDHELVKAGFAWWYRKYAPDNETLKQLEREAREAKRGLWVDPDPIPPWQWRVKRKSPREYREPRGPPNLSVAPGSNEPGLPIIGNTRSRIYHRSDCPSYARVSPKNRVPFPSPDEAEKAGYRLARNCPS